MLIYIYIYIERERVEASDTVRPMGQIELNYILMLNLIS